MRSLVYLALSVSNWLTQPGLPLYVTLYEVTFHAGNLTEVVSSTFSFVPVFIRASVPFSPAFGLLHSLARLSTVMTVMVSAAPALPAAY